MLMKSALNCIFNDFAKRRLGGGGKHGLMQEHKYKVIFIFSWEASRLFLSPQSVGDDHSGPRGQHESPDVAQFQNG